MIVSVVVSEVASVMAERSSTEGGKAVFVALMAAAAVVAGTLVTAIGSTGACGVGLPANLQLGWRQPVALTA